MNFKFVKPIIRITITSSYNLRVAFWSVYAHVQGSYGLDSSKAFDVRDNFSNGPIVCSNFERYLGDDDVT